MKKINVIDLDKTLIPFDSFRFYVLRKIKKGNIKILYLTLLRKLRLLSASYYKKKIIVLTKLESNKDEVNFIIEKIINSIDKNIMNMIKENTDENTINILCSASPDGYVKQIAEYLNWEGFGSKLDNNFFYHMWGGNKIKFINIKYPQSKYIYNYAISDSESDLAFLKMFQKYEMVK